MNEFVRFALISNLSLLVIWGTYALLLQKNTFHGAKRAYLLSGSVFSLLVPFLPIANSRADLVQGFELPVIWVGESLLADLPMQVQTNWMLYIYVAGVLLMFWLFVRGVSNMVKLLNKARPEVLEGELVLRSDLAGPFSFLSIIHLPNELPADNAKTILRHELAHVRLGHSYDVLWLNILRIMFWFNPFTTLYIRTIQDIHEYQADALTHTFSTKEHYVKIQLEQLFQLPSGLSMANSFYNSNDLKKRINMIYSEKTSKWGSIRFLIAVPAIACIGLVAACTEMPTDAAQKEADKVYKTAEVMPEYPGGMQELMNYMIASIKYPAAAQEGGLEGQVFVQFIVNAEGKVTEVEVAQGVRYDLDAEAVRVVSEMPDWTPGQMKGKNVSVQMTIPISYKVG